MHESYWITNLLNALFAGPVDALLNLVGVHVADPAHPINDTFALEFLIAFALIVLFAIVRMRLSVENPGAMQQVAEMVHEFTGESAEQIIGHGYQRFQAFTTCVFVFIIIMNLTGLIPGIVTPTSAPVVPLGIAICTFIYYHFYGFKEQGFLGYMKHFAGPIWWISWLLFPIEIISHCARVMSLTIRLYANMFASDLVTLVFFSLVPVAIPAVFLGLHAFVSLIQAYVFMLLSMIYLSEAVAHEH
ncbi:F0F1 ATP synthase subunit A [Occallatibacter riparius]|uniref:ATP synthase subunit a n=1 Tax=Occallatibacter riparius TaxID=1002689 RepID=A0A9J7BKS4_9BACT|nr:F0F1 ATP synthase subunit A [Occallatibacter riparius]UWZ83203.1 F0F1 ATP synthase subunit A [Occallatibacter riparius]